MFNPEVLEYRLRSQKPRTSIEEPNNQGDMDSSVRTQVKEGPPVRFREIPDGEAPLMRTPSSRTTNSDGRQSLGAMVTPLLRRESSLTGNDNEARRDLQQLETVEEHPTSELINLEEFDNTRDDVGSIRNQNQLRNLLTEAGVIMHT